MQRVKFEVESKFCQKLKIFITTVLSEISDFDHFWTLPFLTCEWIAGVKLIFWSVFLLIWTISESLRLSENFVKNWKFWWPRSLAKFQILTTFWTLSFLTCEWIASIKIICDCEYENGSYPIFWKFWVIHINGKLTSRRSFWCYWRKDLSVRWWVTAVFSQKIHNINF